MQKRILRGGKPAVTITYNDDYSRQRPTAIITIAVDGQHKSMLMQWVVTGAAETSTAYQAITRKNLMALMDVLDGFTATLPNMAEPDAGIANAA